jgi:hypothetical protein
MARAVAPASSCASPCALPGVSGPDGTDVAAHAAIIAKLKSAPAQRQPRADACTDPIHAIVSPRRPMVQRYSTRGGWLARASQRLVFSPAATARSTATGETSSPTRKSTSSANAAALRRVRARYRARDDARGELGQTQCYFRFRFLRVTGWHHCQGRVRRDLRGESVCKVSQRVPGRLPHHDKISGATHARISCNSTGRIRNVMEVHLQTNAALRERTAIAPAPLPVHRLFGSGARPLLLAGHRRVGGSGRRRAPPGDVDQRRFERKWRNGRQRSRG